ncbi:MAG: hypothetical protein K2Z80_20595 [Xanthobacteraceae bacterium]|nr:hypothetical protein [Xanthobacteraceae bacterium]
MKQDLILHAPPFAAFPHLVARRISPVESTFSHGAISVARVRPAARMGTSHKLQTAAIKLSETAVYFFRCDHRKNAETSDRERNKKPAAQGRVRLGDERKPKREHQSPGRERKGT